MKNELLDKDIILPSGESGRDKINFVAGAIMQPLIGFLPGVWVSGFLQYFSKCLQSQAKADII